MPFESKKYAEVRTVLWMSWSVEKKIYHVFHCVSKHAADNIFIRLGKRHKLNMSRASPGDEVMGHRVTDIQALWRRLPGWRKIHIWSSDLNRIVTMKPMNRMPWGHACIWMHLAYHPSISKTSPPANPAKLWDQIAASKQPQWWYFTFGNSTQQSETIGSCHISLWKWYRIAF